MLPIEEAVLPEAVLLVAGPEAQAASVCTRLASHHRLFQPLSAPEVRAVLTALVNKIQKWQVTLLCLIMIERCIYNFR